MKSIKLTLCVLVLLVGVGSVFGETDPFARKWIGMVKDGRVGSVNGMDGQLRTPRVSDTLYTDVIAEDDSGSGVTVDGVLLKDGSVTGAAGSTNTVDVIAEATSGAGVTVDGVLHKDGGVTSADGATNEVDVINEATAAAGVTVEGVLMKDNEIITPDGSTNEVDHIVEAAADHGVMVEGILLKDGELDTSAGGTNEMDHVVEQTADHGVVVESVTIKDGEVIAADGATNEVDAIIEATADAGVTVEGVLLKDSGIVVDGGLTDIGSGTFQTADGDNDLGVAGDLEVDGTLDLDGNMSIDGQLSTTRGVGTVNATYCSVVEEGFGNFHQTTLTITGTVAVALADGDHGGGAKLYDFPEGVIKIHGVTCDLTVTNTANFNASDDDHFYVAVGTVVAADDNDLTATEANLIAKIDEDTAAGVTVSHAETTFLATTVIVDGSSTACDAAINFAIEATDNSDANTVGLTSGDTITITWSSLGDY